MPFFLNPHLAFVVGLHAQLTELLLPGPLRSPLLLARRLLSDLLDSFGDGRMFTKRLQQVLREGS